MDASDSVNRMSLADALPTLRCSSEPIRYNDPEVLQRAEVQRAQDQQLQARLSQRHRSVVDQLTGWWRETAQHHAPHVEYGTPMCWACMSGMDEDDTWMCTWPCPTFEDAEEVLATW